jgi:hypothetical protein
VLRFSLKDSKILAMFVLHHQATTNGLKVSHARKTARRNYGSLTVGVKD